MALLHANGDLVSDEEWDHHRDLYVLEYMLALLMTEYERSSTARNVVDIAGEALEFDSGHDMQRWQAVARYEKLHRPDLLHIGDLYLGARVVGDFERRFNEVLSFLLQVSRDVSIEDIDAAMTHYLRAIGIDFAKFRHYFRNVRPRDDEFDFALSQARSELMSVFHAQDGSVCAVQHCTLFPYVDPGTGELSFGVEDIGFDSLTVSAPG